jgi:hypothetical protein
MATGRTKKARQWTPADDRDFAATWDIQFKSGAEFYPQWQIPGLADWNGFDDYSPRYYYPEPGLKFSRLHLDGSKFVNRS